ncbi:MAG: serine hydrolase [Devosia sp.]|nr:serine hydrolase [Devosia sp.]
MASHDVGDSPAGASRWGGSGTVMAKSDWDRPPWNRWSFQHVREILPTAEIWRGRGPVRDLPRREEQLDDLPVEGFGGTAIPLLGFLEESFTDGLLVLRDGAVAYERYLNGMHERTLHLSQSVAKSFVGVLAGILAGRGVIATETELATIVPELADTAYLGARLRHVLDMTSGVRFTEDYTDPRSGMARLDVAAGWKPPPDAAVRWPGTVLELIGCLDVVEAPHGSRFSYRSIETDVLALVLERATGGRLPDLLSEMLWQPLGMEESGNITVDAAGFALGDGGLSATLRDYGRFGQMILDHGAGIVPEDWIAATRSADHAVFGAPYDAVLPRGGYRNQFWVEDEVGRNLMARGVFGQLIHIDFARRTVVVKLSSWPHFVNPGWTKATLAAVRRIGAALG